MTIGQMKGNPERLPDGRLKPLHGNTKLSTVEEKYQRDYFKGLPRRGTETIADARHLFSKKTGRPVVGVKEMRRLCILLASPHVPFIGQLAISMV